MVYLQHNINSGIVEKQMSVVAGNATQAATTNPPAGTGSASNQGKAGGLASLLDI